MSIKIKKWILQLYRSPNSSQENNTQMCSLINDICKKQGNTLILWDFNLPHIDWKTWNTTGPLEYTFVDTLRKNFLHYWHSDACKRNVHSPSVRSSHIRWTIYRKYWFPGTFGDFWGSPISKTKIGTEVVHVTRHWDTTVKVKISKVKVTRPLSSPPCWRVRRLQRWAWERVDCGKLLLRCRLLGGARRVGAHEWGDGRGHTVAAAHLQLVYSCNEHRTLVCLTPQIRSEVT